VTGAVSSTVSNIHSRLIGMDASLSIVMRRGRIPAG
jgi:hypothetical protein